MDHQAIFNAMRAVVEAPGYHLLQSYKNDFYMHDAKQIHDGFAVGVQYIWVVRENGTHLAQIGVHEKLNEHASAALSVALTSGGAHEIYHLSAKGVRKVSHDEARSRLLSLEYLTDGQRVMDASGKTLATFTLERVAMERAQTGTVHFTVAANVQKSPAFLKALSQIALGEMVKSWASWFCFVQSVSIDGSDIATLLDDQLQPKTEGLFA